MLNQYTRKKFLKTSFALLGGSLVGSFLTACGDATPITSSSTTSAPTTTLASKNIITVISQGETGLATPTALPALTPAPTLLPDQPFLSSVGMRQLDLRAKIGQTLMVTLPGNELTDEIRRFLQVVRPGGIWLDSENFRNLGQIKRFTDELQSFAASTNILPFIISIDEEGGVNSQFPPALLDTVAPAAMAQAAAGNKAVYDCARETATRLANLGFNLNLAPVADIHNNPPNSYANTRAYGGGAQAVAVPIREAVRGYRSLKFGSCLRHFPGLGDTVADSIGALQPIRKSREELDKLELVAFKAGIEAGVPMIMVGHGTYPLMDATSVPASLSPLLVNQLLRTELKFKGLILTDDLTTPPIKTRYKQPEAALLALNAGADMMVLSDKLEGQLAVFTSLVDNADKITADLSQITERICSYKATYVYRAVELLTENNALYLQTARAALTLLRHEAKMLPLTDKRPTLIACVLLSPADEQSVKSLVGQFWQSKFNGARVVELNINPSEAEQDRAIEAAKTASSLVVISRDAYLRPAQAKLIKTLLAGATPPLVVAVRSPYDVIAFPEVKNYLAAYSDSYASTRALVDAMTDGKPFTGKLPLAVNGIFEVGAGTGS